MPLPIPIVVGRRWRHLDAWDALIFAAALALAMVATFALQQQPGTAIPVGFSSATGALALRRLLSPRLSAKEAGPPPPPLTALGLLLTALGGFGMLVSLFVIVLGAAMMTTGALKDRPPVGLVLGFMASGVAIAGMSTGLFYVARRRRQRQIASA
jgi:hypothetical protein